MRENVPLVICVCCLGAGGNAGIGKAAALEFAKMGARVVIASRNLKKSEKARDEIISESKNKNVIYVVAMLSPKLYTTNMFLGNQCFQNALLRKLCSVAVFFRSKTEMFLK